MKAKTRRHQAKSSKLGGFTWMFKCHLLQKYNSLLVDQIMWSLASIFQDIQLMGLCLVESLNLFTKDPGLKPCHLTIPTNQTILFGLYLRSCRYCRRVASTLKFLFMVAECHDQSDQKSIQFFKRSPTVATELFQNSPKSFNIFWLLF